MLFPGKIIQRAKRFSELGTHITRGYAKKKGRMVDDIKSTIAQLFFISISIAGTLFFLWFVWPAVFKGIINAGNLCGMFGSAMMAFYGLKHQIVHQAILQLWQVRLSRVVMLLFLAVACFFVVLMGLAAIAILCAESKEIPENMPAIVLGCSVKGTRPSRILAERIDAAQAYMQTNPDALCVLSGGQGKGEDISEAECMYRELVKAGADKELLRQEAGSTNTQENLENSMKILESLGMPDKVVIISSEFHLYRGRKWAETLGYESYGYAAQTDWRYLPTFFLREMIAVIYLWLRSAMMF